ncbi:PilZ domain protein [Poriferisphaera corsica]|uniref:PilZ domain protein n=1 Tax=Poriferisphaera corsica TaxID=2528020 RepID=A0A517YTV2_9BACT|nr:PilZ domain-containing protein [Poriferisphaera corsica]QDU33648.1 PilZ domain protein [Poriferisphaera corsica]
MERRRFQRVAGIGDLNCCLGEVVDLSAGGMQVIRKGKQPIQQGDFVNGMLEHDEGQIDIRARVVWVRKLGFFRWAFGLEFIEMNEKDLDNLVQLVECGHHECVGPRLWAAA